MTQASRKTQINNLSRLNNPSNLRTLCLERNFDQENRIPKIPRQGTIQTRYTQSHVIYLHSVLISISKPYQGQNKYLPHSSPPTFTPRFIAHTLPIAFLLRMGQRRLHSITPKTKFMAIPLQFQRPPSPQFLLPSKL